MKVRRCDKISCFSSNSEWRVCLWGHMPGSKIWLVPIGFCVTRAWQKCENARSISFSPFQCFSIVLEGQRLYELVEDVHSFLAMYFFSQFVELLWPYFLYCAMCENTPSVIVVGLVTVCGKASEITLISKWLRKLSYPYYWVWICT